MACTRGAFQSHGVIAGPGRAGRDLVGVVADAVVVVVLAQFGPEGLELVPGHPAVQGAGTGSFKRIEATAPPRQWPGQREISLF